MERYDVEELILDMADIVHENRFMRQEITRLKKVEEEYHQSVLDRFRASEEAGYNLLKTALVSSKIAINNMDEAEKFANM